MLRLDFAELLKEVFKLPWKNTSLVVDAVLRSGSTGCVVHALNCKRFARTCLSIGENRAVVALNAGVYDGFSNLFEELVLAFVFVCNIVKRELVGLFGVEDNNLVINDFTDAPPLLRTLLGRQNLMAAVADVICSGQGAHSDNHLDVLLAGFLIAHLLS